MAGFDRFSLITLVLTHDGEYMFTAGRDNVGRKANSKIIDIYSTRTWEHQKSWTFEFGDRSSGQNVVILPPYGIDDPFHIAISNHDFNSTRGREAPLIASSDGRYFTAGAPDLSGIFGIPMGTDRLWVSPNCEHMVYVPRDENTLHYWDFRNPT